VLAPGDPDGLVQFIDARDLGKEGLAAADEDRLLRELAD
jgi:hypothetical protein